MNDEATKKDERVVAAWLLIEIPIFILSSYLFNPAPVFCVVILAIMMFTHVIKIASYRAYGHLKIVDQGEESRGQWKR
jgi:hypothetical protein